MVLDFRAEQLTQEGEEPSVFTLITDGSRALRKFPPPHSHCPTLSAIHSFWTIATSYIIFLYAFLLSTNPFFSQMSGRIISK